MWMIHSLAISLPASKYNLKYNLLVTIGLIGNDIYYCWPLEMDLPCSAIPTNMMDSIQVVVTLLREWVGAQGITYLFQWTSSTYICEFGRVSIDAPLVYFKFVKLSYLSNQIIMCLLHPNLRPRNSIITPMHYSRSIYTYISSFQVVLPILLLR